ncbi:glutamine amidotransferase [Frankineae bacterium MT45]|nr:glutamine amidotransferase [Frankineae bacterium MT45]
MCRLFGLHAGSEPVSATFWLLDAPDSLAAQSHRNPDGVGIGVFDADGQPRIDKQPIAAWSDTEFATAARDLTATTFVAHVRHASTGAHTIANTHPFQQSGRLFAHNGVVQGLDQLDARLAQLQASELVEGETDSERVFALITAETARNKGDLHRGILDAIGWIAANLPVYSLNFVLTTPMHLWALRYPAANELWVLERAAGGDARAQRLEARTDRIHARSAELTERPSVLVASEPMDADPGWRRLDSGELLRVDPDLQVHSSQAFPEEPAHPLTLAQLEPTVAASQHAVP